MEVIEYPIFLNSIYQANLNDISNKKILSEIDLVKKIDLDGVLFSNRGGWQSHAIGYSKIDPDTEVKKLFNLALSIVDDIYKIWGISDKIEKADMWFNINGPGAYNSEHDHAGSKMSAVYYVDVPKDSGNLVFVRPDNQNHFFYAKNPTEYTFQSYEICPSDGLLVICPSNLRHYVTPNISQKNRVSIAINFM